MHRTALLLGSAFLCLTAASAGAQSARTTLDIYVVDVEGGNATLFVNPAGESLLIDTGNANGAVRDAERIFAYRALRIARGDETPLPGFDENAFVSRARLDDRSYAGLIEEYAAVRAASVALFDSLFPEEWTRRGIASDKGVSVRALAWIAAGHEIHHLGILSERYLT